MTLTELGTEYALTARTLRERIRRVEEELEAVRDETEELQLKYRLRLLRSMHRDARAVALYLEHYYDYEQKRGRGQDETDVV